MTRLRGVVAMLAVAALVVGCGDLAPLSLDAPPPSEAATVTAPSASSGSTAVETISVAYPDEPASFVDATGRDAAAIDLTALWGLPLFRVDADGQRVPALAASVTEELRIDGEHVVTVDLRAGEWSDGVPVTSADVVATVEALRPLVPELGPLRVVEAVDADTVRLVWGREVVGWWTAVDALGTILPAHVLADGGLAAFQDAVPVAGGSFRLVDRVPGLSLTFATNPSSPLGAPATAGIEVLVVPRYETALGLLESGEVDAVLGHLALNPEPRALAIPGVEAAAPLGGTTVTLELRPGGGLGGPDDAARRREVVANIRLEELVEGLLGDIGTTASSAWPAGPDAAVSQPAETAGPRQLVTVLPRGHEVIGFTARAVQRDVATVDVDMQFVSFETPIFQTEAATQGDAAFRIRREPPRPLLSRYLPAEVEAEVAAAAMASLVGAPVDAALQRVADEALVVPLYRVGAAQAWDADLVGIEASSWPGLAFSSASSWRRG